MSDTAQSPDVANSLTLSAATAPGQVFFCRRVEIPQEVAEGERHGYVQLQVEGLSPFPLEQLQYGYLMDDANRYAFVYCGYRRSFDAAWLSEWSKRDVVIPDFSVALLAKHGKGARPLLLVADASICYFEFDDRSELPCYFQAFPREATEQGELESLEQSLEKAKAALGDRVRGVETRLWQADKAVYLGKQDFLLRARESARNIAAPVSREQLWTMDLRGEESIEQVKQTERRNQMLWRGVTGLAAGLLLLLAGEGVWGLSRSYLQLLHTWNAEREPIVATIESKNATAEELQSFRESEVAPFSMLLAIEPYRSSEVVFSRVETEGAKGLKIFAIANSNTQANQFKARLEGYEQIDSVVLERVQGSASGTTFTMIVTFKTGWSPERQSEGSVARNE